MTIIIKREAEDRLSKKTWVISASIGFNGPSISIFSYHEKSRLTRRHKYKIDKNWYRTIANNDTLTEQQVMNRLTQDVVKEAKDKIKEAIDKVSVGL